MTVMNMDEIRARQSERRSDALSVACPSCGVAAQHPCVAPSGWDARRTHADRYVRGARAAAVRRDEWGEVRYAKLGTQHLLLVRIDPKWSDSPASGFSVCGQRIGLIRPGVRNDRLVCKSCLVTVERLGGDA